MRNLKCIGLLRALSLMLNLFEFRDSYRAR